MKPNTGSNGSRTQLHQCRVTFCHITWTDTPAYLLTPVTYMHSGFCQDRTQKLHFSVLLKSVPCEANKSKVSIVLCSSEESCSDIHVFPFCSAEATEGSEAASCPSAPQCTDLQSKADITEKKVKRNNIYIYFTTPKAYPLTIKIEIQYNSRSQN